MRALIVSLARSVHSGAARPATDRIADLIRRHTEVTREHLTPELALHLITPRCHLWTATEEQDDLPFRDPYWAFYWPGGQAVARYLLDNPSVVVRKTVLDVGCGSGACAIAAAKGGAKKVTANDIDPVACVAATLNADLNSVHLEASTKDLVGSSCEGVDCVLLGDMFYDPETAARLLAWTERLREAHKMILLGDPGRHHTFTQAKGRMTCVAEYDLPEYAIIENRGFSTAKVWALP